MTQISILFLKLDIYENIYVYLAIDRPTPTTPMT